MDKLIKTKIRSEFLEKLNVKYQKLGWKFEKKNATFSKGEFEVFCGVSSEFHNFLVFQPQFWVKVKQIAEVLNQIFPDSPIYNQVGGAQQIKTIKEMNVEFTTPYLDEFDNYTYKVYEDTEITPMVEDHFRFMEKVGFPFFENFTSLEKIDNFINNRMLKYTFQEFSNENTQKELLNFFYGKRATFVGVTAAYLINNPLKRELIDRYRYLHTGNNYVLEDFEKFTNYLEANFIS